MCIVLEKKSVCKIDKDKNGGFVWVYLSRVLIRVACSCQQVQIFVTSALWTGFDSLAVM